MARAKNEAKAAKLKSPAGTVVHVSEAVAETLRKRGYQPATKGRTNTTTTTSTTSSGAKSDG